MSMFNNVNPWKANIFISQFNKKMSFLVDTGADVICLPTNLIPESCRKNIRSCTDRISGPDNKELNVFGQLELNLSYNNVNCNINVIDL